MMNNGDLFSLIDDDSEEIDNITDNHICIDRSKGLWSFVFNPNDTSFTITCNKCGEVWEIIEDKE